MKKLSNLEIKLIDEYRRCMRNIWSHELTIKECRKGSIQKKLENGKLHYYLVYRDGRKVVTKYIRKDEIVKLHAEIQRRKEAEEDIKAIKADMKILKRALGKELVEYAETGI